MRLQGWKAQGKGWRTIATETGHSKNIIKKYLRDGYLVAMRKRPVQETKLAPFIPQIEQWMREGLFNCVALRTTRAERDEYRNQREMDKW
jgi:hypothetical protein